MGFSSIGVIALKMREVRHDLQWRRRSQVRAGSALLFAVCAGAAIAVMLVGSTAKAVAMQPLEIVPHRAAYLFEMVSSEPGGGVSGVSGGMTFAWADTCDGWALDQHYLLRVSNSDGSETDIRTSNVSWESKDGMRYRFNIRRGRGAAIVEDLRGDARLKGAGAGGAVEFSKPKEKTIELPPGTKFPTSLMFGQMRAAADGARMQRDLVFEGGSMEGAQVVTTAILAPRASRENAALPPPLGLRQVWPMYVAYFPADNPDGNPETEISLDVQANGIVPSFVLDYGIFKLRAVLDKIEPLPDPGC